MRAVEEFLSRLSKLNILGIISIIITIILIVSLGSVGILPIKFFLPITLILLILNGVGIFLINRYKMIPKIIGIVLLVLLCIISSIGTYYANTTNKFIDKKFSTTKKTQNITYYVVALKKNNYTKKDIEGDIGYYKDANYISSALEKLKENYVVEENSFDELNNMFEKLNDGTINLILVEKSSYNIVLSLDKDLEEKDFDIIYKFDIKKKISTNKNASTDNFNVYIGGSDFAGLMDFNMLVTVNTNNHKMLLTSIPRDYYVDVYATGKKDKLSFITQGIDTNIKTLENLFDTSIDYYIKIDTDSLVTLVDQIGGINYCSDVSFTTTHALVRNTYNDSGRKLTINKGCQHLNGVQTLAVARERNAFPGRDRVRQANCRKIMVEIFKELVSTDTITNYNSVLDSVGDTYETNIPKSIITKNIKDIINNGNKWQIETQAVDGTDGKDLVHLSNYLTDWVMYPNYDMVDNAKVRISDMLK